MIRKRKLRERGRGIVPYAPLAGGPPAEDPFNLFIRPRAVLLPGARPRSIGSPGEGGEGREGGEGKGRGDANRRWVLLSAEEGGEGTAGFGRS